MTSFPPLMGQSDVTLSTAAISVNEISALCTAASAENSALRLSALLFCTGQKVILKEASGKVFLQCASSGSQVTWWKDGNEIGNTIQLDLGAVYDDPRGIYICEIENGQRSPPLQVHYRSKCCKPRFQSQDCLEFSPKHIFEGTTDFPEFKGGSTSSCKS